MQLRLGSNTKQEIDDSKGLFVYFNVPHDTPEIRANIRGLILCLSRPRFYQKDRREGIRNVYTARALDGIEVHFMSDELLNRGVNSLIEIEFTLKHLLAQMADKKDIQFFIDKPGEPALTTDGVWDMMDNKSIETGRTSNLEVGSLLETNSITDVLKIAMLDDGTIGFPDVNPFNLESKLDDIRTDIYESKTHFLGGFTELVNWFAGSFRETPYVLNNPLATNTFYAMFLKTFNNVSGQNQAITLPGWLGGWTINLPIYDSAEPYLKTINKNVSTSFNEDYDSNTLLASNSYFRYLHTWLNSDWKLFQTVSEEIRDCICEAKGFIEGIKNAMWGDDSTPQLQFIKNSIDNATTAIEGLQLNPTINNNVTVDPTPVTVNVDPTPVTVNACCDELVEATRDNGDAISEAIKEIVKAIDNDGTITTDNGDGTYTTKPIMKPDVPIDPSKPDSPSDTTYTTTQVTKHGNSHDAICGFQYYTLSQLADFIENLIGWLDVLTPFILATGVDKWAGGLIGGSEVVNAVQIGKMSKPVLRTIGSKWLGVSSIIGGAIPDYIREVRDDLSCGSTNTDRGVLEIERDVINFLQTLSLQNQVLDFCSYMIHVFYQYGLYSPLENATGVNISDYAQYCPCPLEGDFSGHWYNNDAVNPYHLYLTANGSGEGWNGLTAEGGQYYQNYFDMTQDELNPLFTSGTATIYNNVTGTLSGVFSGVTFTLNSTKDMITMDNGIQFTKV